MLTVALSVIWWIFLVCLTMGVGAWLVFWWSIRSGQFDDPEAPAAEMLEHDKQEFVPREEQRT